METKPHAGEKTLNIDTGKARHSVTETVTTTLPTIMIPFPVVALLSTTLMHSLYTHTEANSVKRWAGGGRGSSRGRGWGGVEVAAMRSAFSW